RGEIDGAAHWNRHMDAVLRAHQSPSVVLVDTPQQAQRVAEALERERIAQGSHPTIDSVTSLQRLVPARQEQKLPVLRELLSLLRPRVIASLPPEHRAAVEEVARSTVLKPIAMEAVPSRLREAFVERDGRSGLLVLVTPSLEHADARAGRAQIEHARRVRALAQQAVPGARVAGTLILSADIVGSIVDDGAVSAALSFAAVVTLTLLLLRSVRQAAWVLGSLCLGVLWLGGAMGALGLNLNFVNFVVLPITFGIGADYAVNLYLRHRQLGGRSPLRAVAASGGAVALCSATTMIGYAALLVADNRAIFSFGLLAVLGELSCLTAALVALPAFLELQAQAPLEPPPTPFPQ
ncbi:MAG: MMPL family transporter, partial [Myxococcales bacterium]